MKVKKASVRIYSDRIVFKLRLKNGEKVTFATPQKSADQLVSKWLARQRAATPLKRIDRLLEEFNQVSRKAVSGGDHV